MSLNDYYLKELQALRTLGVEFSHKNPALSTFLARKGQDPDVERLLEGFSFLTGRLRQYIDEELPEVSHTLAQLLWPNFLRTVPSYSILEFVPLTGEGVIDVPKGEEVMAIHKEQNEQAIFTTCYKTEVLPLSIEDVRYHTHGSKSFFEIDFQTIGKKPLSDLEIDKLRLYVGNNGHLSENIYLYFSNYVETIEVDVGRQNEFREITDFKLKPVGFSDDENILPHTKNVFRGYILLQEFFCFREKFYFFDLENFSLKKQFPDKRLSKSDNFTLRIVLSEKIKITDKINKNNIRINCTPIVNIFESEAEPIRKKFDDEFEVIPANYSYENCEVYSILKAQAWDSRLNKYHKYLPFESFEHVGNDVEYYYTRVKLSSDESRTKTYVGFISNDLYIQEEDITVSFDILATNRNLPSTLSLGDICNQTARSKVSKVKFKNITIPTKSHIPPLKRDFMWRIVSSMSLNYLAIKDIESLRNLIETYDFIGINDLLQKKHTESLLQGLTRIAHKSDSMILNGLPVRGVNTILNMDYKRFGTAGEAYLFASVLSEFFSMWTTANSYNKLDVILDQKAHFSFRPKTKIVSSIS